MNKIIVIEGTDCSGKATQTKKLKENLEKEGRKVFSISFPNYESPTGKIIGGPYLGKNDITEGWFLEKAPNVDAKVGCLYYAADRYYNLPIIQEKLGEGYDIILDRYTYSNMAHQGGRVYDKRKRQDLYRWIEHLEFDMLSLPKPDIKIFLHMPLEAEQLLKANRKEESLDQNENDKNHLKNAERAYLEIVNRYHFHTIECVKPKKIEKEWIKTPEEISIEIWKYVQECFKEEKKNPNN